MFIPVKNKPRNVFLSLIFLGQGLKMVSINSVVPTFQNSFVTGTKNLVYSKNKL